MSLTDKAMLISVKVSIPTGRKIDKDASKDVTHARYAQDGSHSVSRKLFIKEDIGPIEQLRTEIRAYVNDNSMPWSDKRQRLIPSNKLTDMMQKLDDFSARMDDLKQEFIARYDLIKSNSMSFLGDGYNDDIMPTLDDLERSFGLEVETDILSNINDFRVKVSEYEFQRVSKMKQDEYERKTRSAITDLWTRLSTPLSNLINRLSDPTTKRYHKSLITNVMQVTDALPSLNIFNDPNLEAICQELKQQLDGVDIADIKKDDIAKKSIAQKSSEIMDRISGFMQNTDALAMQSNESDASDTADASDNTSDAYNDQYQEAA